MRPLAAVAAMLVVFAGCSDILGPSPTDVSGDYELIVIAPNGAGIARSGILRMDGGRYSLSASLANGRTFEESGTYSVRRAHRIDHRVTLNPLGVDATWSNGHLIYRLDNLEWVWTRLE